MVLGGPIMTDCTDRTETLPGPHLIRVLFTLVGTLGLFVPCAPASAHEIQVHPYLQRAAADSIYIHWESTGGTESTVEWGLTAALGNSTSGDAEDGQGGSQRHSVHLTNLEPATRYYYRTVTEDAVSQIHDFITPAEQSAEAGVRLVAMSDMQKSGSNPDKFREVVEDGVIEFVTQELSADLPAELAMAVIPGDLVVNGWTYSQFADDFFNPGKELWAHVPLYPVPGNHENDSSYFFDYFNLPPNGSTGFEEHWWYLDRSNLRVIGLDSNSSYRIETQLDWLEEVLDDACTAPEIDFVFAQLHHPFKSELWLPGETGYTGSVVEKLEAFSTQCGKPSLHFFGHTHGYSRGQSRDHNHHWVNVATAGGAIDNWGDYPQADYPEFVATHADWGFVLVDVVAGDDPSFRLRRVSRGSSSLPRDNEVRDDFTVRLNNTPPEQPTALSPSGANVSPDGVALVASLFADNDGDLQGASQWQVASSCDDFTAPVQDRWLQYRNEYFGVDLQADDDLSDEWVETLSPMQDYCWRVRFRDRGLAWSEWSEGLAFSTGTSALSDNLLLNPGAEDGTDHWVAALGPIESLTDGECDSVPPHAGTRLFAVGGVCADESDEGAASQRVDLSEWSEAIDAGKATAVYGGWMRNYGGSDRPELATSVLHENGTELARSETLSSATGTWTEMQSSLALPVGARTVDFLLFGTRNAGSDNDSYFDDLSLRLLIDTGASGDDDDAADDDDDDSTGVGLEGSSDHCGACTSSAGLRNGQRPQQYGLLLLLVLTATIARRRQGGPSQGAATPSSSSS